MRIVDYLDKGASLGPDRPCFTTDGDTWTYAQVQALSDDVAHALVTHGVRSGSKVAVLSGNDPLAFACVFGISRAAAVWCPVNPRNEAAENREILDRFDCEVLLYASAYRDLVERIRPDLPSIHTWVQLDGDSGPDVLSWDEFRTTPLGGPIPVVTAPDDLAMIVGTGGTTGRPKGVQLTGTNLETMTALTLMSYPFPTRGARPVYLALAPLTHAAGVLCFPVLASGGEIVIMRTPDVGQFLRLIPEHRVTHTFLPPTLIYMVLAHPDLDATDLSSLMCFWYGAAPMSPTRLAEALDRIGPMAQLFGQTEAPMMISVLPPAEHRRADGSIATEVLRSAGRPTPLVTVAVMGKDGTLLRTGERGEIVIRSSLVMSG